MMVSPQPRVVTPSLTRTSSVVLIRMEAFDGERLKPEGEAGLVTRMSTLGIAGRAELSRRSTDSTRRPPPLSASDPVADSKASESPQLTPPSLPHQAGCGRVHLVTPLDPSLLHVTPPSLPHQAGSGRVQLFLGLVTGASCGCGWRCGRPHRPDQDHEAAPAVHADRGGGHRAAHGGCTQVAPGWMVRAPGESVHDEGASDRESESQAYCLLEGWVHGLDGDVVFGVCGAIQATFRGFLDPGLSERHDGDPGGQLLASGWGGRP